MWARWKMKWRQSDCDAFPDVVGLSLGLLGLSLPRSHGLALLVHLLVGVVQLQKKSELELYIGRRAQTKVHAQNCGIASEISLRESLRE